MPRLAATDVNPSSAETAAQIRCDRPITSHHPPARRLPRSQILRTHADTGSDCYSLRSTYDESHEVEARLEPKIGKKETQRVVFACIPLTQWFPFWEGNAASWPCVSRVYFRALSFLAFTRVLVLKFAMGLRFPLVV